MVELQETIEDNAPLSSVLLYIELDLQTSFIVRDCTAGRAWMCLEGVEETKLFTSPGQGYNNERAVTRGESEQHFVPKRHVGVDYVTSWNLVRVKLQ